MKDITVCKASTIGGREAEVSSVTLSISGAIPEVPDLLDAEAFYRREAAAVREALRSLPQGTRYQLLLLLLKDAPVMYRGAT